MTAKYRSSCARCGGTIHPGESIILRGGTRHGLCPSQRPAPAGGDVRGDATRAAYYRAAAAEIARREAAADPSQVPGLIEAARILHDEADRLDAQAKAAIAAAREQAA